MGHTDCTAVKMSREEGWYEGLAFPIARRIRHSTHKLGADASLEDLVATNVVGSIRDLRKMSRILRALEKKGEVVFVGAVYEITTGRVKLV
jgi:carbonic anhydrase